MGAVLVVGALAGWHAWSVGGGRPLPYRDLTRELGPWEFTHFTARTYRSRESLRRYLRVAWPGRKLDLPPIDFEREEAVLTSVGPRSGDGYDLRVLRVTEERRRIEVVLRERAPTPTSPGRVGLTYPYRLIVFPRSDKRVTIRIEGRP